MLASEEVPLERSGEVPRTVVCVEVTSLKVTEPVAGPPLAGVTMAFAV